MAVIFPRNFSGTVSVSVGNISVGNYASDFLNDEYAELSNNSSVTIPAGAFSVLVHNTGLGNIIVSYNGNDYPVGPNGHWSRKAKDDRTNQRTYFVRAVTITVPDGALLNPPLDNSATYSVERKA